MNIIELLDYAFFRNALLGSFFASIACGIIGTYVVTKRLVFISGGITHASLGGLGIGFYFGFPPILSAMLFSILSAFGIQWLSQKQDVRGDSAIAVFWSLGMAVGILLTFLTPGYAPNLSEYLFGNILTITRGDIGALLVLSLVLLLLFGLFFHAIVSVSFDTEFARTRRLPAQWIEYAMMLFIAVTIVLSIRLVGIVLLMSLITVPQMTANLFTVNYAKMISLSVLFSFVGCVVGLLLSYYLNVPSGAFIIFILILLFFVGKAIKAIGFKKAKLLFGALIIGLSAPSLIQAQTTSNTIPQKTGGESILCSVIEVHPEFPGGTMAMMDFIDSVKVYPQEAIEKKIEGRVICRFFIEHDGSLTDVQIMRSVHPLLDAEAIRIIKAMPKWKPGMRQGKIVRVRYVLPIRFDLEKSKTTNGTGAARHKAADSTMTTRHRMAPSSPLPEEDPDRFHNKTPFFMLFT